MAELKTLQLGYLVRQELRDTATDDGSPGTGGHRDHEYAKRQYREHFYGSAKQN